MTVSPPSFSREEQIYLNILAEVLTISPGCGILIIPLVGGFFSVPTGTGTRPA